MKIHLYRIVREVTGIQDPYKNIKQQHIAESVLKHSTLPLFIVPTKKQDDKKD